MPGIGASARPVSRDRHRTWSWRRPEGYAFAHALRSFPVTLTEAVPAASCFPLVFVPGPCGLMLHALLRRGVQGLTPFIAKDGQWQAAWLPPRLAAWPFDLVEATGGQALALHETSDLLNDGPGGTPIFKDGDVATLSPETAQMAALLKTHAEALPATLGAAMALRDRGLLSALDGDATILMIDPAAAADLDEAAILMLHRAGALVLLHAALVSLAHLPWMEKAEKRLVAIPAAAPRLLPAGKPAVTGSSFLEALAAETPAVEALLQFPGHSPS